MKKKGEIREKKAAAEVRQEVREYIRNERDTVLKKWMALKESIASEDVRREQFFKKKAIEETKSLPVNILKFIGTMKKAVRVTMRYTGGTPYSIVRSMFIYWDADKSGLISAQELLACMKHLGARVTLQECQDIVRFYQGQGTTEMDYRELLADVQRDEPSIIAFVTTEEEEEKTNNEIRFEEVADKFFHMPPLIKKFLEAVRNYLSITMRDQGGTPFQHIRHLFSFYDYDYSNGLNPKELVVACRRTMKLHINEDQARQIVDYYDRRQSGEIQQEKFLEDVCADVLPLFSFVESSPTEIEKRKKSLQVNPFIPKPFAAPPNKVLEKFKANVNQSLVNKVNKLGGSVASWIREAFVNWDRTFSGKIADWHHLQGAAQRLGVSIDEDEAKTLMACYDRDKTGELHYMYFAEEITRESPHFLTGPRTARVAEGPTSRTPSHVRNALDKIRRAVEVFVKRSKGVLQGRDVLHGTFLLFDSFKSGRVSHDVLTRVIDEIRAEIDEVSIQDVCIWFDTDGSKQLDYNALVRQVFGADVSTERLQLPRIREPSNYNKLVSASTPSLLLTNVPPTLSSFVSTSKASTMVGPSMFGVAANTMEKNLENIESQAIKLARVKQKKQKILGEKVKVERKLAMIEEQRKKVIDDYKARKAAKTAA